MTCDVAIAGAGIGGLAAALALRKAGFSVAVFERAQTLDPAGAGIQLSPNAVRVLDGLGLASRLRRLASAPQAIAIRSRSGRPLARMPLGESVEKRHGAPYLVIHRADLQSVLLDAARETADLPVLLGAAVEDFEDDGEGVTLRTGGPATRARVLIGADGLHSLVRERLVADGPPRPAGRTAWRSLAPAIPGCETGLWLGPDAHLVQYPVMQGAHLNLVVVTKDGATPAEALHGWCAQVCALIRTAQDWRPWPLFHRPGPPAAGRGRVALLGDAFHPLLPFLAQGGAMAIEDAAILARELRRAPEDPAGALRRYEAQRAPRRARAAALSRRQGDIYHLAGLAARARDLVLTLTPPPRLLARQDWLYGWRP